MPRYIPFPESNKPSDMHEFSELSQSGKIVWYDQSVFDSFDTLMLEPAWLERQGLIKGTFRGRNTAYVVHIAGRDMVLRHYYRGGLVGKLLEDSYFWRPAASSRALRELRLLTWMRKQNLPVPRVYAACQFVSGMLYKADILLELLPESRTLADCIRHQELNRETWRRIGAVIGQMHKKDVCHADLNCRNILLDANEKPWLIDFDKSRRRRSGSWKKSNLARLHRSLSKEKRNCGAHWSAENWSDLCAGVKTAS